MYHFDKDALTGAYSRANLQACLEHFLRESAQTQQAFSLVFIDLDHFKSINDAFGHARGDDILVQVAKRTQTTIRDEDLLFRYGGDEFLVLLPLCERERAIRISERLLERIQNFPFSGTPDISLSLSIGVATYPEDGTDASSLFQKADDRAYLSKRHGRATITASDETETPKLAFSMPSRLIERDDAQNTTQTFFKDVQRHKRGVLNITGEAGSGVSTFLTHIASMARLQNMACLRFQASRALSKRLHGSLINATLDGRTLEQSPGRLHEHLSRYLQASNKTTLVILIEDASSLDAGSKRWLEQLWEDNSMIIAVAYAGERPGFTFNAPLECSLALDAFSVTGLRLWLRGVLHQDLPEVVTNWLFEHSKGLPGVAKCLLEALEDTRVLHYTQGHWQLDVDTLSSVDTQAILKQRNAGPLLRLPDWPGLFVGREQQLRSLAMYVQQTRLLTIIGEGGLGKTRLAVQVATEQHALFPDGVYFVDLQTISLSPSTAQDMASEIATVMGVSLAGTDEPLARVSEHLKTRKALLILDNFEHLISATDTVKHLHAHCLNLHILITSREALRLEFEQVFMPGGLDIPLSADASAFESCAAVQLFLQRASQSSNTHLSTPKARMMLDAADRQALLRICQLSEGLPLVLELAAAWTSLLGLRVLADELESSLSLLERSAPAAGRLTRVIDYFWGLLSKSEQRTLSFVSVFKGSFSLEAARDVADASAFFLLALTDRALLKPVGHQRYALHALLRHYAEQQLSDADQQVLLQRYARYYSQLATSLQDTYKHEDASVNMYPLIDLDLANFRYAWQLLCEQQDSQALRPMAIMLRGYHDIRGYSRAGLSLYTQASAALIATKTTDPETYGWLLEAEGLFLFLLGRANEAKPKVQQSLACLPEHAFEARAVAYNSLGILAYREAHYTDSLTYYEQARALHEQLGNRIGAARVLGNIAHLKECLGRPDDALAAYEEAVRLHRELDNISSLAIALLNMGTLLLEQNRFQASREALLESLNASEQVSYKLAHAVTLSVLGQLNNTTGAYKDAIKHLKRAVSLCQDIHAHQYELGAELELVRAFIALGDASAAHESLLRAEALLLKHEFSSRQATLLLRLAQWLALVARPRDAVRVLGFMASGEAIASLSNKEQTALAALRHRLETDFGRDSARDYHHEGQDLSFTQALALLHAHPTPGQTPAQASTTPSTQGLN